MEGLPDWQAALRGALRVAFHDHALVYHPALRPAVPPEYHVPGIVGLTFRLRPRPQGGHEYVTTIDLAAAVRLGARIGLDPAEAVALVDSHERVHIHLQIEGATEAQEEAQSRFVDAVWVSLRHPRAEGLVRTGAFGVVHGVGDGFWEALVDPAASPDAGLADRGAALPPP